MCNVFYDIYDFIQGKKEETNAKIMEAKWLEFIFYYLDHNSDLKLQCNLTLIERYFANKDVHDLKKTSKQRPKRM